jgi:patatin-like phospholipase/acyl hydrolase
MGTGISQIKYRKYKDTEEKYLYTKDFVKYYESFTDCREDINEYIIVNRTLFDLKMKRFKETHSIT